MHWVRPMRTGKYKNFEGQKFNSSTHCQEKNQEINFYIYISQKFLTGYTQNKYENTRMQILFI